VVIARAVLVCASPRCSLMAIVENDDPRADVFCAPAENPAGLDRFDDGEEATVVIERVGNPTVLRGDVAEMKVSMPVGHGVFVAWLRVFADELERLAGSKMLIRIAADLDPDARSAPQLCDPARVGPHALLLEERQRIGPAALFAVLLGLAVRWNQ